MRKILVFILMGFALVMNNQINAKEKTGKEYLVYVKMLMSGFAKEVKEEYGLICRGTGGSMPHNVAKISMTFYNNCRATVEQARNLEVILIEKFLKKVNEHKKIWIETVEKDYQTNLFIME